MYNKIFTWLIAAVNDIYSMSKTRSRVISPALAFKKTVAMFSANFNCKLDKGKCVNPGKTLSRAVCAEVVGNMSVSRQVGHVVSFRVLHGFSVSQLSWQLFNHSHNFSSIL